MADTGAPFEIPYVEPTDLVRNYPAASEDLAEAIADQFGLGFQFVGTRYYTSSGEFAKADPFGDSSFDGAKLRAIRVRLVGAGGGSGGCGATGATNVNMGGSGGGGGYAEAFITNIAGLDASVTVTRGAGGDGGAAGVNAGSSGGASSFGAAVSANGGSGGSSFGAIVPPWQMPASVGGGGTAGDLLITGSSSQTGNALSTTRTISGNSGSSQLSGEIRGTTAANGGLLHGGGSSGGFLLTSASAIAGAAGANGIVIVDVFA